MFVYICILTVLCVCLVTITVYTYVLNKVFTSNYSPSVMMRLR